MPVDYRNYPPDWKQISLARRETAGWKCEFCGVPHNAVGYRTAAGEFVKIASSPEEAGHAADIAELDGLKVITIILTVAHLNHDTADNRPENLRALCQRCHNRHDQPHRQRNAATTRRRKRIATGQLELI